MSALLVPALATLVVAAPASASTILPLQEGDLIGLSERVVRGVVEGVRVDAWGPAQVPVTVVTVRVEDVWKGERSERVEVYQAGGESPDGRVFELAGAPRWTEGQDVVVFAERSAAGVPGRRRALRGFPRVISPPPTIGRGSRPEGPRHARPWRRADPVTPAKAPLWQAEIMRTLLLLLLLAACPAANDDDSAPGPGANDDDSVDDDDSAADDDDSAEDDDDDVATDDDDSASDDDDSASDDDDSANDDDDDSAGDDDDVPDLSSPPHDAFWEPLQPFDGSWQELWPLPLDPTSPETPVDFIEARLYLPYSDGPLSYSVAAAGTPCSGSTDRAACDLQYELLQEHDEDQLEIQYDMRFCDELESEYQSWGVVLWNRGDEWGVIANLDELLAFLGPVDSVGDVALLAWADRWTLPWDSQSFYPAWLTPIARAAATGFELVAWNDPPLESGPWDFERTWTHTTVDVDGWFAQQDSYVASESLEVMDYFSCHEHSRVLP